MAPIILKSFNPNFHFLSLESIIHTTFHVVEHQGIVVVTAQHNIENTSRLDPSSILVVFQALYKGFEGFVFVMAIDQAVHYRVYLVCF